MSDIQINCQVIIPEDKEKGIFSDAFRIVYLPEIDEWALDFMELSSCRTRAEITARVLVDLELLEAIRDRMDSTLEDIHSYNGVGLSSEQIDEMWEMSEDTPEDMVPVEGAGPQVWFTVPVSGKGE